MVKFLGIIVLLFTVVCLRLSADGLQMTADSSRLTVDRLPAQVCFHEQCLAVEIADTNEERMRGLQARELLPEGEGMLFIFPAPGVYHFWMKDTLISLDMIFLDEDRRIVGIERDVPPCQEDPCPQYGPAQKSLYVLEANAGYAARHDLKIGDEAIFK